MKQSIVLCKTARSSLKGRSTAARVPLLQPLALYRRILRCHRLLPPLQRQLGDEYVRNEFKAHKDTENPLHIVGFLSSWQDYLRIVSDGKWSEGSLSREVLDVMSPEQVNQLYELMKETEQVIRG